MNNQKLLHINSSGRFQGSVTREASDKLITHLIQEDPELEIIDRDLASGLPFVDEPWINANFTDPDKRTTEQKETLEYSDKLVKELQDSHHIVIAVPIYNFSIPAVLKAWVDQIARVQLTFHYTENGPIGMLKDKKATVVMASGGVPIGSEMDMASPYIKHALSFIGISNATIVDASTINNDNISSILS
jgi:FMN-dependent NADH-azoreductase